MEAAAACVVLRPDAEVTEAEVIARCKALIAGFKCPRKVFIMDALPMSGAGKILKSKLREPHWKGKPSIYAKDDASKSSYS